MKIDLSRGRGEIGLGILLHYKGFYLSVTTHLLLLRILADSRWLPGWFLSPSTQPGFHTGLWWRNGSITSTTQKLSLQLQSPPCHNWLYIYGCQIKTALAQSLPSSLVERKMYILPVVKIFLERITTRNPPSKWTQNRPEDLFSLFTGRLQVKREDKAWMERKHRQYGGKGGGWKNNKC